VVTLRDAINAVLDGRDLGTDPSTVLRQHGLDDLPAEAFSSALLHFAERAPMGVADALAPIVARISPVPFELDDLHPSEADAVLDDGGDVFDLLTNVGPVEIEHHSDADPSGFDHGHDAPPGESDHFGGGHEIDPGPDGSDSDPVGGDDVPSDDVHSDDGGPTFGAGHDPIYDIDEHLTADTVGDDPFHAHDPLPHAGQFGLDDIHGGGPIVPTDDGQVYDVAVDDLEDEATEPLHEGLEDFASSINDVNHEIDHLDHGHIDPN
jgi:hypothetical protein